MNRRLARMLVSLYPHAWRDRYGAEFEALLEESPSEFGAALDVIVSALGERVSPTIGGSMTAEVSQWQSWGARAPWLLFGVAPLVLLAAAYSVALLILWSGWRIFLPAESTPFVPVSGWAIAYFGVGRMLYFFAPIMVGVCLAVVASRSRIGLLWPIIGGAAVGLIDSVIQVVTVRPTLSEAGRVGLELAAWHPWNSVAVLALTIAIYLLLRSRQAGTQTA